MSQGSLSEGQEFADAWSRARDLFGSVLDSAADRGVTLSVEVFRYDPEGIGTGSSGD